MKNLKFILLAGILATAGIASAQGNGSKQFQSMYTKMDAMSLKKDVAGLSNYMNTIATKNCVFISKSIASQPAQTKTLAQTMATMSSFMPMISTVNICTSKITSAKISGSTATVDVIQKIGMTTAAGSNGPSHVIAQETTNEDTWVKQGGSWKLKVSKMLSYSVTQDGKQLPTG